MENPTKNRGQKVIFQVIFLNIKCLFFSLLFLARIPNSFGRETLLFFTQISCVYFIFVIVVLLVENNVRKLVQKRKSREEKCTEFSKNDILKNVGLTFEDETCKCSKTRNIFQPLVYAKL